MKWFKVALFALLMTLFVVTGHPADAATTAKTAVPVTTTEQPLTEQPSTEQPVEVKSAEIKKPIVKTAEVPTGAQSLTVTEQPVKEKAVEEKTIKEVKILHTNDMHGRLDKEEGRVIGMAKVKAVKEQEQPTLMFDSGDAFQGLPLSNASKGADMAKAMNEVGYDAMTVGNHEFDFGFDQAMNFNKLLNFPIVSSNIVKDGKSVFKPSTVIVKDGIKFGVIGVTTPETKTKTHPDNVKGVTFLDPLSSVTKEMTALKNKVDSYVILSHLGIDTTTKAEWRGDYLADQLSMNPLFKQSTIVVLDGHSHSVIENGKLTGHTMLAQTGTALNNIGKVTYRLDGSQLQASMIKEADTTGLTGDKKIEQLVADAKAKYDKATSKVVFNNTVVLNGERDFVRTTETNLGNAITDAMEAYAQTGFKSKGDFAVTNGGGIRASIPVGDVTVGDIIKVLPFGNTITQIQVSGKDIKAMFEHSLSAPVVNKNGIDQLDANGGFLHVSNGVKVYFDMTQPAGQRVYAVEVKDSNGNFISLDETKSYNVVTNDFLAVGGDGFTMLGGPREEGPSLDTVFSSYMKTADLTPYSETAQVRIISGNAADYTAPVVESVESEEPIDEVITVEQQDDAVQTTEEPVVVLGNSRKQTTDNTGVTLMNNTSVIDHHKTAHPVVANSANVVNFTQSHNDMLPDSGESTNSSAAWMMLVAGAALMYRSRKTA